MDDCLQLESDPELVTAARTFVRDRLLAWEAGEHLDAALLIASELVTNAILHARTSLELRLDLDRESLRVEVYDENPRLPALAPCPPEATSGRGLALVTRLATAWGMENRGDGKVVWAVLGPARQEAGDDCVDLSGVDTVDQAIDRIHGSEDGLRSTDADQAGR